MAFRKKYKEYYELYVKAHPNLSKQRCHEEINQSWNAMKGGKKQVDEETYSKEIHSLKMKVDVKRNNMFNYLYKSKVVKSKSSSTSCNDDSIPGQVELSREDRLIPVSNDSPVSQPNPSISAIQIIDENETSASQIIETTSDKGASGNESNDENDTLERVFEKPAQSKLKLELSEIDSRLVALNEARNLGIGDDNVANITKQINVLTGKKTVVMRKLKIAKTNQKAAKKLRDKKKRQLAQAIVDFPSLANTLKVNEYGTNSVGRTPFEEVCPNLHADILNIATIGAAASDRRRENLFRSVKTLDQLHKALSDLGYKLGRTAVYMRLLPKSASTSSGKKHVRTVPVRYIQFMFYYI